MTQNMRLYFSRLPMAFMLMLFVLGKSFDAISFLCWMLMAGYTYDVLVKGDDPAGCAKFAVLTGCAIAAIYCVIQVVFH